MTQSHSDFARSAERPRFRYLRPIVPVEFPTEADVPEKGEHMELRTLLYQALQLGFGERAWIGSDQFVYWDASSSKQCLAPDVMLKSGGPDEMFPCWKTWERGAPELAVEFASSSDRSQSALDEKLAKYHVAGIVELVRYDPASPTQPLRIWDRIDGDLAERNLTQSDAKEVEPEACKSTVLDGYWVVVEHPKLGRTLRLAKDPSGADLFPTPAEAEHARAEAERTRADAERTRAEEERTRGDVLAAKLRELGVDPADVG